MELQWALREETALHAVLEGALERAAVTLADMAYLPTNVRCAARLLISRFPTVVNGRCWVRRSR